MSLNTEKPDVLANVSLVFEHYTCLRKNLCRQTRYNEAKGFWAEMDILGKEHFQLRNISGTSKWSPWKDSTLQKGVRQGDPLSPLLFVLAANYLQALINIAKDMNLLKLPIPLQSSSDFPVVQYADDTLIIMEADP
jgi:hypothetical protein